MIRSRPFLRLFALAGFLFMFSSSGLKAQGEFFDINTIRVLEIEFEEENWDFILDSLAASTTIGTGEGRLIGAITIDGVFLDSVGIKYKGNSSYDANLIKNPFNIDLNLIKEDQEYLGETKIKLSNGFGDPSLLREALIYTLANEYLPAPQVSFAKVFINDTYIGLYTATEHIGSRFAKKRWNEGDGTRVKCEPENFDPLDFFNSGGATLAYEGADSTDYYTTYEMKSESGWADLVDFCKRLDEEPELAEEFLDVDELLWYLTLNSIILNHDSYSGNLLHNYYMYKDAYGQFHPILWDVNLGYAAFRAVGEVWPFFSIQQMEQLDPLLKINSSDHPLISNILSQDRFQKMYFAHMRTMHWEYLTSGLHEERANAFHEIIIEEFLDDPNKLYSNQMALDNVDKDVSDGALFGDIPGLIPLMEGRRAFLENESNMKKLPPEIVSVNQVSGPAEIFSDAIIEVQVTNVDSVFLAYRYGSYGPFKKIPMTQVSGDIFSADLTVESPNTQYYIWSENQQAGRFKPEKAEKEFFQVEIDAPVEEGLVINEFLAKNNTSVMDEDGEYDDWIELYNNSSGTLDLSTYYLSDNFDELNKWNFPNVTIEPNDYVIVWADLDEDQGAMHANFKLEGAGEEIYLWEENLGIVDFVVFGAQTVDITTGRYPNGTGPFITMNPTFAAENSNTVDILEEEIQEFKVFPNPTNGMVYIQGEFIAEQRFILFNQVGQKVEDVNPLRHEGWTAIDLSNQAPGLYFLRIETDGKVISKVISLVY